MFLTELNTTVSFHSGKLIVPPHIYIILFFLTMFYISSLCRFFMYFVMFRYKCFLFTVLTQVITIDWIPNLWSKSSRLNTMVFRDRSFKYIVMFKWIDKAREFIINLYNVLGHAPNTKRHPDCVHTEVREGYVRTQWESRHFQVEKGKNEKHNLPAFASRDSNCSLLYNEQVSVLFKPSCQWFWYDNPHSVAVFNFKITLKLYVYWYIQMQLKFVH